MAPGSPPTIYAASGTVCHDIAAHCLNQYPPEATPGDFLLQKRKADGFEIEVTQEMVDAIEVYVDYCRGLIEVGDVWAVELPLLNALQNVDEDCGGTADFVRYRPATRHLAVVDLKSGSGTYVEADDNEQLKIYAVGAMLEVGKPTDEVTVTIVQPLYEGAQPIRSQTFKAIDLLDFIADIRAAANKTREENPERFAGDWCKYCPKAKDCPELEKKQHALVAMEFSPLVQYDPTALAAALRSIPMVKERIKAIEEFAYGEAVKGNEIPTFKLVEKRPTRKYKSEDAVVEWGKTSNVDVYAAREVLSPAQLEKRLGEMAAKGKKKEAGKAIEHLVEKVSSGYALVPEGDARPPAKQITSDDFAVIEGIAKKDEVSPLSALF